MKEKSLVDVIDKNMKEYAQAVVSDRALPSIIDGLKPTLRRALFTAYRGGKDKRSKVAKLAGATMEFVPTGDSGIIGAISIATRQWPGANNRALFKPTGAVGSRVYDGRETIAAPRYLSVELSDFAKDFLFVDSEVWDWIDNYDESEKEPKNFLPLLPMCIVNGVGNTPAFGVSTSIFPYKIEDLLKLAKLILRNKMGKIQAIPIPYFGHEFKGSIEKDIINDPKGYKKFICKGNITLNSDKKTFSISELPIGLGREKFIKRLEILKKAGKILNYSDHCTDVFNFKIITKKNEYTIKQMFALVRLSTTISQNLNVLDENKLLITFNNIIELMEYFIAWRLKKFAQLKQYKEEYYHELLEINRFKQWAIKNMKIGKGSIYESKKEMDEWLKKTRPEDYNRTLRDAVLNMKTYHFTKEHLAQLEKEFLKFYTEYVKWSKTTKEILFNKKINEGLKKWVN